MAFSRFLLLIASLLLSHGLLSVVLKAEDGKGYPRVYRTFMPDCGPSALAVELSEQVALCYDPSRAGINYIWNGGLDLSPTLQAKINAPAKPLQPFFYVESTPQPLRLKDASKPEVPRFKGYRYEKDAVVLEFALNGLRITETLRLSEDGRGIIREMVLPPNCDEAFLLVEPQENAEVKLTGGVEVSQGCWRFSKGATIVMHISPKEKPKL